MPSLTMHCAGQCAGVPGPAAATVWATLSGLSSVSRSVGANIFGKTPGEPGGRVALALGLPKDIPTMDLIAEFGRRSQQRIPPRRVSTAPCKENVLVGDAVDVTRFPVPFVHGPDGGRF